MLSCAGANALPVGNPTDASMLCDGLFLEGQCGDFCDPGMTLLDAFSMRFGFYGDYVFNRHMEVRSKGRRASIDTTRLNTNACYIAANLWDRLDLFANLGETRISLDAKGKSFRNTRRPEALLEIKTRSAFSWGLGMRGTIWECGCTMLGAEVQYFCTHPHLDRIRLASRESVYPSSKIKAEYREWQIGAGISHRIQMCVPYIALSWSHSKLNFGKKTFYQFPNLGTINLDSVDSIKGWGYAVGVSLIDCERKSLTVEGRFASERALYVNGQIRF